MSSEPSCWWWWHTTKDSSWKGSKFKFKWSYIINNVVNKQLLQMWKTRTLFP